MTKPEHHLTGASHFREFVKHKMDAGTDPLVRILLASIVLRNDIANGNGEIELTTAGFLQKRFMGSLTKQTQLEFTHGSLQSKKQSIVGTSTSLIDMQYC
jgi:hypothetical protein